MNEQERRTNLAWRVSPGTDSKFSMESAGLLVAGSLITLVSFPILNEDWRVGGLVAVFGAVLIALSFVPINVPKEVEPLPEGTKGYDEAVKAIATSPDSKEQSQIYLGTIWDSLRRVPFLASETVLKANVLILGATGATKTWRAAMMMIRQVLSRGNRSLVFFDHSGDPSLAAALGEIAAKLGMKFAFFTIDPESASHLWPMLDDPAFREYGANKKAQIVTSASGIGGGDGQNAGYFDTVGERVIRFSFNDNTESGEVATWRSMFSVASDPQTRKRMRMTRKDFDNSTHAANVFDRLSEDPRINITGMEDIPRSLFEHAISLDQPIGEPTILLFNLSTLQEPASARFMSRFAIRTLCNRIVTWKGPRVDHVYICVDEFGEVAHRSLESPLRQIRKFSASLIYIFQNLSDLKKDGEDFTDLVLNNSTLKIMMTAKDFVGRSYIEKSGGEVIRETSSTSKTETTTQLGKSTSIGKQVREEWVPRFDANTLNEINSNPDLAIVEAPRGDFSQWAHPVVVEMAFPFTQAQFEQFRRDGWPAADNVRSILSRDIQEPPPAEPPPPSPPKPPQSPVGKKGKRTKPVDPEQARRAAMLAETLRQDDANQ